MFDFSQTTVLTAPSEIDENFPSRFSKKLLSEAYMNYSCVPTDSGYLLKPLFHSTAYKNSFSPEISVFVSHNSNQTTLTLEGKPLQFVRVFIWLYICFALLFEVIMLIIAFVSGLDSIVPLFIPLILAVFGYFLCYFGTKNAFNAVVSTMKRLLQ